MKIFEHTQEYYKLIKPGIVYANAFTTLAAFVFAAESSRSAQGAIFAPSGLAYIAILFAATMLGISCVIASACVFNNYIDRNIDKKMTRTAQRALVTGRISARSALAFASALIVLGLALLFVYVNLLTTLIAAFGFFMYVVVYGIAKRASDWGTVVGSVSGALPIVVGYTAVTGQLDATAGILFLVLVTWQMPHFYAIATYRLDEYKAASIPVLPATSGMKATKIHIVSYIAAYLFATILLTSYMADGLPRYAYLLIVLATGVFWFWKGVKGFTLKGSDEVKWARKVFFISLIVLVSFCVTIMLVPLLNLL